MTFRMHLNDRLKFNPLILNGVNYLVDLLPLFPYFTFIVSKSMKYIDLAPN